MRKGAKVSQKARLDRGRAFPGLKGKVLHYVDTSLEEDRLYIHVRFVDQTDLCFWISARLVIEEVTLSDWKTGDDVVKRTYIQSPEVQAIAAQEPYFQRICRQVERESKRKDK